MLCWLKRHLIMTEGLKWDSNLDRVRDWSTSSWWDLYIYAAVTFGREKERTRTTLESRNIDCLFAAAQRHHVADKEVSSLIYIYKRDVPFFVHSFIQAAGAICNLERTIRFKRILWFISIPSMADSPGSDIINSVNSFNEFRCSSCIPKSKYIIIRLFWVESNNRKQSM